MIELNAETIQSYIKQHRDTLSPRTLCFLIKDGQVLLGKKKKGFGEGKWLGIGGKVEAEETIAQAAVREVQEEIGVKPFVIKKVGVFNFYFPTMPEPENWNQQGNVFLCLEWMGEIRETDEMAPQWFGFSEVPYPEMWPDAQYWLSDTLHGKSLFGEFVFDEHIAVQHYSLEETQYE